MSNPKQISDWFWRNAQKSKFIQGNTYCHINFIRRSSHSLIVIPFEIFQEVKIFRIENQWSFFIFPIAWKNRNGTFLDQFKRLNKPEVRELTVFGISEKYWFPLKNSLPKCVEENIYKWILEIKKFFSSLNKQKSS